MGMGAVGAISDDNASDQLGNESDADEPQPPADNESEQIVFDENTKITDYDFSEGVVVVTFEADRPARATITDGLAGIGEDGAVEVPEESQRLTPGENTMRMTVSEFQGGHSAAVTVDGATVRLSTEMDEQTGENPLQYFGGESGLFTGIFGSMIFALGAAGFVVWREDSGVIEA